MNSASKKIELIPDLLIDEVYLSESMCDQLNLPYRAEQSDWDSVWSRNPGAVFGAAWSFDQPHRYLLAYLVAQGKLLIVRPALGNSDGRRWHRPGWFKLVEGTI